MDENFEEYHFHFEKRRTFNLNFSPSHRKQQSPPPQMRAAKKSEARARRARRPKKKTQKASGRLRGARKRRRRSAVKMEGWLCSRGAAQPAAATLLRGARERAPSPR